MGRTRLIPIASIVIDPELQARERIDESHVEDIAEGIQRKDKIKPPRLMEVLDRDNKLFAIDQHRVLAFHRAGRKQVAAVVLTGTWQDARDLATSANVEHNALKRSQSAKENAVLMCLEDHPDWSDSRIAKHVRVSVSTVSAHRPKIAKAAAVKPEERVGIDNQKRKFTRKKKDEKTGTTINEELKPDDPERYDHILDLLEKTVREINRAINAEGGEHLMKYLEYMKLIHYPDRVIVNGEPQAYRPVFKGFPGFRRLIRYAALPGRMRSKEQVLAEYKRKEEGE